MHKGIAVSPGVTVGTACCIYEIFVDPDTKRLEDGEVTPELDRYETARNRAASDLRSLRKKMEVRLVKTRPTSFVCSRQFFAMPLLPNSSVAGSSLIA